MKTGALGRRTPAECRRRQGRKTTARRRKPPAFRPVGKLKHAPPRTSVFHEVSRAGCPSQQDRKTKRLGGAGRPSAGWAAKACPTVGRFFMKFRGAERPSQQGRKTTARRRKPSAFGRIAG